MPCVTGMGGYDSHVVMATLTYGICTREAITKIPPMEGEPFDDDSCLYAGLYLCNISLRIHCS